MIDFEGNEVDNDNLTSFTNRATVTIDCEYDELDRLRTKTTPYGTTAFEYDLGSRLESASNPDVALAFGYNALDQLVTERITTLADYPVPGDLPLAFHYDYDGVGNLTGLWHPEDAGSYPLGTLRYTYA